MVNFFPGHSLETPDFKEPNFQDGATPSETAEFYRSIGQPKKAEAAIRGAAGTPDKVLYILTPPWVGGFKKIGKTGVQYVNLDVLDTDFQDEVHAHERIHNAHEGRWGKIRIPWFEYMTPARQKIIGDQIGSHGEIDETELVEWLTQSATQKKLGRETQSSYDGFEVPESQKLFRALEKKSDKPIVGSFLRMALEGSTDGQEEFAAGIRIGWNIMLLEQSLRDNGFSDGDAKEMSKIIEEQRKDFVIQDIKHADRLVESYQEAQKIKQLLSQ